MSTPTIKELNDLLAIASFKAVRAQANVTAAQQVVANIVAAKDHLTQPRVFEESAAFLAQEKWLVWRHDQIAELNRELAMALSKLAAVRKDAARETAREQVLLSLKEKQMKDGRRKIAAKAVEAQCAEATSPDARYR